MLQHLFGGVLLEVYQLKQLDLVALWGKDQLVLLAAHAHLERNFVKYLIQNPFHPVYQFLALSVILVLIYDLAKLGLLLGKVLPCRLCPLSETLRELRQGNALPAPVNQFLNVLLGVELRIITRMQFQSFFKILQSAALLIQIIVGIPHTEIPGIGIPQFLFVGLHQFQCPMKQLSALWISWIS